MEASLFFPIRIVTFYYLFPRVYNDFLSLSSGVLIFSEEFPLSFHIFVLNKVVRSETCLVNFCFFIISFELGLFLDLFWSHLKVVHKI